MSVLVKGMEMPKCCFDCSCLNDEYCQCQASGKTIEVDWVEHRPDWCPLVEVPDDVQPVVHGKWEDSTYEYSYYNYDCSVCGCNEYRQIDHNGKCKLFNYCPNCGAKMDGET